MSQLPADCLNEIFEYLDDYSDKVTLRSCLLVNRLWCEVSVRILWRDDWKHSAWNYSTLIACLPSESKEILYNNGIIIPTPTSKPPMFNYAAFCKDISSYGLRYKIRALLDNQPSISSQRLYNNICLIAQEISKMFMNQISSLRKLDVKGLRNITYATYPGANDCLNNLSELICRSKEPYPGFFNQLSQICHNIQLLEITFSDDISNGLIDLILSQNNLRYLFLRQHLESCAVITDIIPALTKLPNTLIKLEIYDLYYQVPSIAGFTNLHELDLSFNYGSKIYEDGFSELQYLILPQLQIFSFICSAFLEDEFLINFLKNNGRNLKELYVEGINGLNLTIAESCPNLKILTTCILHYDLDILKEIFNNCQLLESLIVIYDDEYLNENELLEIVTEYSPKNFHELTLVYRNDVGSVLLSEELESFFMSWTNRIPRRSLSLFVNAEFAEYSLDVNEENMKIIEKYIKLGVIKKFEVKF